MSIATRWPVVVSATVQAGDTAPDGHLTDAGAARLAGVARAAYLDQCTAVTAAEVTIQSTAAAIRPVTVGTDVTVSAAVTEIYPDSFVMATRIRPASGDDGAAVAADVWLRLSSGQVTTELRDELIALAHAASHFH